MIFSSTPNAFQTNRIKWGLILLLGYIGITWLRFHEWRPLCLWGDDLHGYVLFWGKHLKNNLEYLPFLQEALKLPFERVRLVFQGVITTEFFLFKKNLMGYFIFNSIVHSINGCLVCLLAFYFCRIIWFSVCLGIVAITVHFGLFEVTQVIGDLESISLMFCLLTIFSIYKAQKTELTESCLWVSKWKWLSLLFAFFAFNTHERYIVLLPWLALFFVLHPKAGTFLERLAFAAVSGVMILSNVIAKIFVYHVRFFQGTGPDPLTVNWSSIKALVAQGFFSIIGLNHGPEHLVGIDWQQFPHQIQQAALLFSVASLSFVVIALLPWKTKKIFGINWPIYLLILSILLLVPAVLNVRIEQRWELGLFDLMLLLIACGVRKLFLNSFSRYLAILLIICFIPGFVVEEVYLTRGFSNIYLYEEKTVEMVKEKIIDAHASLPGTPLLFVNYPGSCKWGLADGGLFLTYEGKARKIFCVEQMKDVRIFDYPPNTKIYFSKSRGNLEEITFSTKQ